MPCNFVQVKEYQLLKELALMDKPQVLTDDSKAQRIKPSTNNHSSTANEDKLQRITTNEASTNMVKGVSTDNTWEVSMDDLQIWVDRDLT